MHGQYKLQASGAVNLLSVLLGKCCPNLQHLPVTLYTEIGVCASADALRAVEQQLANLYAEEVRERGRNSFLARTLEDVRDTLAAIEKGGTCLQRTTITLHVSCSLWFLCVPTQVPLSSLFCLQWQGIYCALRAVFVLLCPMAFALVQ